MATQVHGDAGRRISQMIANVLSFTQTHGKPPALALVSVGNNPRFGSYISLLKTRCMEVGIRFIHVELAGPEAQCVTRVRDYKVFLSSFLCQIISIHERSALHFVIRTKSTYNTRPNTRQKMTKGAENDDPQVDVELQKDQTSSLAENITNMYDTVPRNNCDIAPSHDEVLNELNTEGTPVTAVTISEGMVIINRNYEQRYKEMSNSTTGVTTQESSQPLTTTIQTIEMQNVDG
ncbi:hypothetical protein L6452_05244 [Arctium lappa]|uniref:Uncharacterized protein n=1 Tax=Arctium lappa TaxID=4217 RepID=A0ACB9EG55_ARCLA|nr:hypothetical protein L6452_05244 [Arctium lappa]